MVLVLLDDVGFGASSVVGGPIRMPTAERLAEAGLLYNRFHTTAICSPTRASLLTGCDAHATGVGTVLNVASNEPGYDGVLRDETATIARILKDAGYATGAFGKWHLTPAWETSELGPFDRWPIGRGFDTFYGFLGGESDHYEPNLYRGTTPIPLPDGPYHFTEDMVTQASDWIRLQTAMKPDQPFFAYLAPGAAHAPLHVEDAWIEKYRGVFDEGWDAIRQKLLAGQIAAGVAPADTVLTERPEGLPAWESLSPEEQQVGIRLMEAYAGFLEHCDTQLGHVVDTLEELGRRENTLFLYVVGDNGSSAEAGLSGSVSYFGAMTGILESTDQALDLLDEVGSKRTYPQYPAGWAWAMCSPFQWVKTVASHFGGTRNPLIVSWPQGIAQRGLRSQFGHVNDIVPTILEVTGTTAPDTVAGVEQRPMDGTSLAYSFDAPDAPERHTTQHFEVFGHRSIYHEGWIASATHGVAPWFAARKYQKASPLSDDIWELYNTLEDFSQAKDLSSEHPDKLAELQELFDAEIRRTGIPEPVDVRTNRKPLPNLLMGRNELVFTGPVTAVPESNGPVLSGNHWLLEAEVEIPAEGVLFSMGSRHAGIVLFLDDAGRANFCYRVFEASRVDLSSEPLTRGSHTLAVSFVADSPTSLGTAGVVRLSVDGTEVADSRIERTQNTYFSFDEPLTVGRTSGSPVGDAHPQSYPYTQRIKRVRIAWGPEQENLL
ncbi:arylsulfatase [Enemella sp. A6]|uniref:arylsulfatase n=1 Tax=Enemella sp. A6 TaxID=3440152 RepID=UPI003EB7A61B